MLLLIKTPLLLVWLLLMVATGFSLWSVTGYAFNHVSIATSIAILVAFIKIYFVGMYFMELRHAPLILKRIFNGWCLFASSIILVLYFTS